MWNLDSRYQPPGEDPKEKPSSYRPLGVDLGPGRQPIPEADQDNEQTDWEHLAKQAYFASTNYVDTNYRKRWEDSLRAFNNQHFSDSKYLMPAYAKRSKLFRPKTRALIRKNEAAAAAAFFSNPDVVYVEAQNQGDMRQRLSAEVTKALVQYRLEKSIPWFMFMMGAVQDSQKSSVACARCYWEFEQDEQGKVVVDKPAMRLIPVENLRFDPAADWTDPVNTSPYFIELIPMFVCDVRERMLREDPKTGAPPWFKMPEGLIRAAAQMTRDSTRATRERAGDDTTNRDADMPVQDYAIAWIQRHIHRRGGKDWVFYMLGDQKILTDPVPLEQEVFHGKRDYVIGSWVLETHTVMPTSMAELVRPVQEESNEIANQRLDNVKLVLNKRWFVARGKNVDLASLMRNVPGGATMMDKPKEDIVPIDFQDVTGSSYQEQDRLNADFDELGGNFSANSVGPQGRLAQTVGGAQILNAPASMMTEYGLLTLTKTFVEKVLQQLVLLEQKYETDRTVLLIAAQKSPMWMRFGQQVPLDQLLLEGLTIRVSVGLGSADPAQKLAKLVQGVTAFTGIAKNAPPWMNLKEIGKEFWGLLGYQDGTRFFNGDDPTVLDLQNKLQQSLMALQKVGQQLQNRTQDNQTKFEIAKLAKESRENVASISHSGKQSDPMHEHLLKAHEIALQHDRKTREMEHDIDLKFRKFAAEIMLKIEALQAKTALASHESATKAHEASTAKEREHEAAKEKSKPQPIIIQNIIPKPSNKKVRITRGKDGFEGQVIHE